MKVDENEDNINTDINDEEVFDPALWTIQKVCSSDNQIRIFNQASITYNFLTYWRSVAYIINIQRS